MRAFTKTVFIGAMMILLFGATSQAHAALLGTSCAKAELGMTKVDTDNRNVIACLLNDEGTGYIWKSMSGGGIDCPKSHFSSLETSECANPGPGNSTPGNSIGAVPVSATPSNATIFAGGVLPAAASATLYPIVSGNALTGASYIYLFQCQSGKWTYLGCASHFAPYSPPAETSGGGDSSK